MVDIYIKEALDIPQPQPHWEMWIKHVHRELHLLDLSKYSISF